MTEIEISQTTVRVGEHFKINTIVFIFYVKFVIKIDWTRRYYSICSQP